MSNLKNVKSVTISAYLNGTSQFNFNFQQNGWDMSDIKPDIAVVRSINFFGVGNTNQGLDQVFIPYQSGVSIYSNINSNKPIGTFAPTWNPSGNATPYVASLNHSSSPGNVIFLGGVTLPAILNFYLRKNNLSTTDFFKEVDTLCNGYLALTIDFIEYKK